MLQTSNVSAQLRLLCVLMGFGFLAISMAEPLVPLYALSLGASPFLVGLIVATAHLFPVFLAVPMGSFTDRWGTRRVTTLGAVLFLAGPFLVIASPGLPALLIAQVLMGVGQLGMVLAAQTFVGLLAPPDKLESYFGWYTTAISAGQLAGPLLAGSLMDMAGYYWAFAMTGFVSVVPTVLSRRLLARPGAGASRDTAAAQPSPKPIGRSAILRNPEFQVAVFGSCGVLVAMGVRRAFLPVYLDDLAYSASFIGLVMSVRSLFSMFVRIGMEQLVRALGGRGMALVIMTFITALSIGALGYMRSPTMLIIAAMLTGLGMGVTQPLTMVIASDAVPASQHGLAMGIRLTGNRVAQLISPLIFGVVAQWSGYGVAFLSAGLLLASVSFVTNRLRPRLDPGKSASPGV